MVKIVYRVAKVGGDGEIGAGVDCLEIIAPMVPCVARDTRDYYIAI